MFVDGGVTWCCGACALPKQTRMFETSMRKKTENLRRLQELYKAILQGDGESETWVYDNECEAYKIYEEDYGDAVIDLHF